MRQFFFEVSDGDQTLEDRRGLSLPDLMNAREEAVRIIRHLMREYSGFFLPNSSEWHVLVKGEGRNIEMIIPFTQTSSSEVENTYSSVSRFAENLRPLAFRPATGFSP